MNGFEIGVYIFSGLVFGFLLLLLLLKLNSKITHGPKTTKNAKRDKTIDRKSVKILQYNVFWRPNIAHIGRKEYSIQRSKELLKKIDEYDVLCLDEAFACIGGPAPNFLREARNRGFIYISRSPACDIFSNYVIDGGVIILSKLPILKHDNITFQLGSGVDMFAQKGCVYAKIQLSKTSHFHLFATHLQANYKGSEREDRTVRNCQLREIKAFIQRTAIDSFPIVLAGDLNINSRDAASLQGQSNSEYNRLFQTLALDEYELTDCLYDSMGEQVPTFGEDEKFFTTSEYDLNSKQRIDYVLAYNYPKSYFPIESQKSKVVKMESDEKQPYTHLSDHYGIQTIFEFTANAPVDTV